MLGPIRFTLALLSWAPLSGILIGYAGVLHPLGDSISVFRPFLLWILVILSILMLLVGEKFRGLAGVAIAILVWFETLPPGLRQAEGGQGITVYQKNLLYLTKDTSKLQADIRNAQADFVMLQELHARNLGMLNDLRDLYPYQHQCTYLGTGSLAVLSRWPAEGAVLPCGPEDGLAAMLVDTGRHRVWVGSVHLRWPWPYPQAAQLQRLESFLSPLEEPLILAGDFNMVHWSFGLKRLARLTSLRLAGSAGETFEFRDVPFALPIDHVFMPDGAYNGSSETRPKFGSDHFGVVSQFILP